MIRLLMGSFLGLTLALTEARAEAGSDPCQPSCFDWNAGIGARSLPRGAAVTAEVGYNHLLWGEAGAGPAKDKPQFMYGFVRPSARLATSVTNNYVEGRVAIHPVSFVSLHTGIAASQRASPTWHTLECANIDCGGVLTQRFVELRALAGAGRLVGAALISWRHLRPDGSPQFFADEGSVLVGDGRDDTLLTQSVFAGVRMRPELVVGASWMWSQMTRTRTDNLRYLLAANLSRGSWRWTVAAGTYQSSTRSQSLSAALAVEWIGRQGLALAR